MTLSETFAEQRLNTICRVINNWNVWVELLKWLYPQWNFLSSQFRNTTVGIGLEVYEGNEGHVSWRAEKIWTTVNYSSENFCRFKSTIAFNLPSSTKLLPSSLNKWFFNLCDWSCFFFLQISHLGDFLRLLYTTRVVLLRLHKNVTKVLWKLSKRRPWINLWRISM